MKIINYIKSLDLNIFSFFVLVIYPLILVGLFIHYALYAELKLIHLFIFLIGYYVSNISVGVGVHRLWSHSSYKTHPIVEFFLAMFFSGTLQGPVFSWVSNHIDHHSFTDTEKDPHTPLKYRSKILGFLWSHIGWMLVGEGSYKSVNRITMKKLGKNKILRFQFKYYLQCAIFMNLVLPFLLGFLILGGVEGGYAFFIFIGLGRALQQEVTFFVNSLCHFIGSQKYVGGTSGDIWWLAFLLLGENWHNFHHAFPNDYRNGSRWYHFDVHKWIIYFLKILGLARDLKVTSQARIELKVLQLDKVRIQNRQDQHLTLQERIEILTNKINQITKSDFLFLLEKKQNLERVFENLKIRLYSLKLDLQNYCLQTSSQKVLDSIAKRLYKVEESLGIVMNKYT